MKKMIFMSMLSLSFMIPSMASAKLLGACNTAKGCKTLQRTCLKAKGDYSTNDKGNGFCNSKSKAGTKIAKIKAKSGTSKPTRTGATKIKGNTGPVKDSYCYTKSFCKTLKSNCGSSGGTYKSLSKKGDKGVCRD